MPRLTIQLFGAPRASLDGMPINFESKKVWALLAYLLVEADRVHERIALAGFLWPDMPERNARRNLSQALFNLRQNLGTAGDTLAFLTVTRSQLQCHPDIPSLSVDVCRFQSLLQQNDPPRQVLHEIADLYQAPLLDGFFVDDSDLFEQWAAARREQFQQQALAALARLTEEYSGQAEVDYEKAAQFARRQLALEPWREEAHRQLMRALAGLGQRSEALKQYERCVQILEDELGVLPDVETERLYLAIQGEQPPDEASSLGAATGQGPREPVRVRRKLPAQPNRFVGRAQELAEMDRLLADPDCRLLTLLGPGGIGKSRLALEWARHEEERFPDGLIFVPLADRAGHAEARKTEAEILQALIEAIELPIYAEQQPLNALRAFLQQQRMLLILDNCEHLINGFPLVTRLLAGATELTCLATSRERLGLQAEWILEVDGLPVSGDGDQPPQATDAVQLFAQRARQIDRTFALDDETAGLTARICRLVQGQPLAIELAAAWIRHLPLQAIEAEIRTSFDFLETGLQDIPARHRSLRAVFEQSWQKLSRREKDTLMKLSVFRGGFSRSVARSVGGADLGLLAGLTDKSLIRRAANGRYELHELVRQFARERLDGAAPLAAHAQKSHALWFGTFLREHLAGLSGNLQRDALTAVEVENENIRAGWRFAVQQNDPRLIDLYTPGLFHYLSLRGWYHEGVQLFEEGIAALPSRPEANEVSSSLALGALLTHQAQLQNHLGRLAEAHSLLQKAMPLVRLHNRTGEIGFALNALGLNAYLRGRYDEATAPFEEALTCFRQDNEPAGIVTVLNNLGNLAAAVDESQEYTKARALYEESIAIARETGNLYGLAQGLINVGAIEHAHGALAAAGEYYQQAIRIAQSIENARLEAISLTNLGETLIPQERLDDAQQALKRALSLKQSIGDQRGQTYTLNILAMTYERLGDTEMAQRYWLQSIRIGLQIRALPPVLDTLLNLARSFARTGRNGEAAEITRIVLTHPATEIHIRREAESLLGRLDAARLEAMSEADAVSPESHDLLTLVQRLLAEE